MSGHEVGPELSLSCSTSPAMKLPPSHPSEVSFFSYFISEIDPPGATCHLLYMLFFFLNKTVLLLTFFFFLFSRGGPRMGRFHDGVMRAGFRGPGVPSSGGPVRVEVFPVFWDFRVVEWRPDRRVLARPCIFGGGAGGDVV